MFGDYPRSPERGVRSERAMTLAVAEMDVQGVSTRKVTAIVQDLCGLKITSTQVSRAAAKIDEQLGGWRSQSIGEITYLVLDARCEKVRHDGAIVPGALLTAIGISPDGKRSILGCSVQFSEAETHWRSFLQSLLERGMRCIKLVVSDDHAGVKNRPVGGPCRRALATLPVSSRAECDGSRAEDRDAGGGRRRPPPRLRCR
jgi:putative transposase